MKIEYLSNIEPSNPKDAIIRILDFDSYEACLFKNTVSALANGTDSAVDLAVLPFVESVGLSRLILRVGEKDEGVIPLHGDAYVCILTKEAWKDVQSLVEPFCRSIDKSTHQWLYNLDNDIELLFSPSGSW